MKLFTKALAAKLAANGAKQAPLKGTGNEIDFVPVVKLFNPAGAATWLLTETDPDNPTIAFGLCDLGMGSPELGYVDLDELSGYRGRFGLGIERDLWFRPGKDTLSQFAQEARGCGRIKA